MTYRFAVVYEGDADFRIASDLADRVLIESIEWLQTDDLPHHRDWVSQVAGGLRFTWAGIKQLAADAGIKVHGHFDGEPGLADASAARRAIVYLRRNVDNLSAIVLMRDQDDVRERRKGLEQAQVGDHGGLAVVIGLAIVERESWVICGFEPIDDGETTRLDAEKRTLGFDPRLTSHELTACKDDNAIRSPKRVLRQLIPGDRDRERRCWAETRLDVLHERGEKNGLSTYLQEVQAKLAPLIGHVPHH